MRAACFQGLLTAGLAPNRPGAAQASKSLFQEVAARLGACQDRACQPAAAASPAWAGASPVAGWPAREGWEEPGDRGAAQEGSGCVGVGASAAWTSAAAGQAAAAVRPEQGGAGEPGGSAAGAGKGQRGVADVNGAWAPQAPGQAAAPAPWEHSGAGGPYSGAAGGRECGRDGAGVAGPGALGLTRCEWESLVLRHLAVHTDRLGAREDFALACRCRKPARPAHVHCVLWGLRSTTQGRPACCLQDMQDSPPCFMTVSAYVWGQCHTSRMQRKALTDAAQGSLHPCLPGASWHTKCGAH